MGSSQSVCSICGYKNPDPEVIKECEGLGTPRIELAPGTRVTAYGGLLSGTVSNQTRVRRNNRKRYNHSPRHLRWYFVEFDNGKGKWLTLAALTAKRGIIKQLISVVKKALN